MNLEQSPVQAPKNPAFELEDLKIKRSATYIKQTGLLQRLFEVVEERRREPQSKGELQTAVRKRLNSCRKGAPGCCSRGGHRKWVGLSRGEKSSEVSTICCSQIRKREC